MNYLQVFGASALAIAVLMVGTWVVSLALKNASIVDIVWGAGFVLVAWVSYAVGDGTESRRLLLACMVTLWGGRLAIYLFIRNHGKGEDPRYVAMRKKRGDKFALQSLWVVFGLQGVLMWIVSLPVQVGSVPDQPDSLGPVEIVGIILYTVGVYFESMGDMQLSHFKADPDNAGQGHGPGPLALHPPPQLLRRLLRLVGHLDRGGGHRRRHLQPSSARSS